MILRWNNNDLLQLLHRMLDVEVHHSRVLHELDADLTVEFVLAMLDFPCFCRFARSVRDIISKSTHFLIPPSKSRISCETYLLREHLSVVHPRNGQSLKLAEEVVRRDLYVVQLKSFIF